MDVKIGQLTIGDDFVKARRLYPKLIEFSPAEWIAPKEEAYPLRAVGVKGSSIASLFGYSLEIRSKRFNREDRVDGVLKLLGPVVVTPNTREDGGKIYRFERFSLRIDVNFDNTMFGGFYLVP